MEVVVAVVSCTYPVVFVLQGIAEQLDVEKEREGDRERGREGGRERICMFYIPQLLAVYCSHLPLVSGLS